MAEEDVTPTPSPVPGDAELVMDHENPLVGEQIDYRLKVELPPGFELQVPEAFPFPTALRLKKAEVTVRKEGNQWTALLPLMVMRYGRIKIPELSFTATDADNNSLSVRAGEIIVFTGSHFENESEPEAADAEAPVSLVQTNWILIWVLIVLAVVLASVGGTLWLAGRRRNKKPTPKAIPIPAHIVAGRAIDALEKERLAEEGEFEAFYTRLSEILRDYLGRRWLFDSLDLTTTELMAHMDQQAMANADYQLLANMLMDFDLVKFARFAPSITQSSEDMERTRGFITQTASTESGEVPS